MRHTILVLMFAAIGGCTDPDAAPAATATAPVEAATPLVIQVAELPGVSADGAHNDHAALRELFAALDRGDYGDARVVLDFGSGKTYCALYDPAKLEGNASSDRCDYIGAAIEGGRAEATLALHRGNIEIRIGANTVLDASLSITGALGRKYLGTYLPTGWHPAGTDFGFLFGDHAKYIERADPAPPASEVEGKSVVVELSSAAYGDFTQNQAGIHVSMVDAGKYVPSGRHMDIQLHDGIRFPFNRPKFSLVDAVKIRRGTYAISADRTSLTLPLTELPGDPRHDIIRMENLDGTDSVYGNTAYFEYNRIASTARAGNQLVVTLTSPIAYEYGDFWLIRPRFLDGVHISGAGNAVSAIRRLAVGYAQHVSIAQLTVRALAAHSLYDFTVDHVTGRGCDVGMQVSTNGCAPEPLPATPPPPDPAATFPVDAVSTVLGFTFCRNGVITDLDGSGAQSERDNANIKLMSPVDVSIESVHGHHSKAWGVEGEYAFYSDFAYTPYNSWAQNLRIAGVIGDLPFQGSARTIWLAGVRRSEIRDVTTAGLLFVNWSDLTSFIDVTAERGIEIEGSTRLQFQRFTASHLRVAPSIEQITRRPAQLTLNEGRLIGPLGAGMAAPPSKDRCLWLNDIDGVTVDRLLFYNATQYCDGTSIFLQNATDIRLSRVSDLGRSRDPERRPFRSFHFHQCYDQGTDIGLELSANWLNLGRNVCP